MPVLITVHPEELGVFRECLKYPLLKLPPNQGYILKCTKQDKLSRMLVS